MRSARGREVEGEARLAHAGIADQEEEVPRLPARLHGAPLPRSAHQRRRAEDAERQRAAHLFHRTRHERPPLDVPRERDGVRV